MLIAGVKKNLSPSRTKPNRNRKTEPNQKTKPNDANSVRFDPNFSEIRSSLRVERYGYKNKYIVELVKECLEALEFQMAIVGSIKTKNE